MNTYIISLGPEVENKARSESRGLPTPAVPALLQVGEHLPGNFLQRLKHPGPWKATASITGSFFRRSCLEGRSRR